MVPEALTALAAAGGIAVVEAAASDAWSGVRERVARLLGRGDSTRERAELERLDQTADALQATDEMPLEQARTRQAIAWQTRFEMLLESLPVDQQEAAAAELRAVVEAVPTCEDRTSIHNEISGGTQYGPVMQGRDFHGQTFTTMTPQPAAPDPQTTDSDSRTTDSDSEATPER
ncbi:hypothetical protein GCM10010129_82350 [Streptomyces fumigatiscleroticus]|nr:hypothetical protein GCM10010129_82350 [Streptomyces fumigatiscleroticus]